jgi:electron transport complex protein RnfC
LRTAVLPERYPQGALPLLVPSITGREMRLGGAPREVGAAVVDAVGLCGYFQAHAYDRPLTHVIITVQGDAVARRIDCQVAIGTAVNQVIEAVECARPIARVLAGGPLRGRALRDGAAVVDKSTRCLTLLSHKMIVDRAPIACIRCGWCVDDCPVGLDPAALMNLAEQNEVARAARLHPQACVDCGICSYVCPAHLDLMESVRTLKRGLGKAERLR